MKIYGLCVRTARSGPIRTTERRRPGIWNTSSCSSSGPSARPRLRRGAERVRQFASTGFRIWNLSLEAKVVYTGFGVLSLLALFVSALFYEDLVGHDTTGVRAYYAGEAPRAAPGSGAQAIPSTSRGKGPAIALPDEPDEAIVAPARGNAPLTVAVTYRKLLEVTHFHLFTVPVFLLIVAHLFMLTGLQPGTKAAWIAGGFGSSIAHIAAPWLLHYAGGGWTWLYAASGAGLGVTSTVLTLYPVWAMWFGRPASPSRAAEADRDFYEGKIAAAVFFATTVLPRLTADRHIVENTDVALMDVPEGAF